MKHRIPFCGEVVPEQTVEESRAQRRVREGERKQQAITVIDARPENASAGSRQGSGHIGKVHQGNTKRSQQNGDERSWRCENHEQSAKEKELKKSLLHQGP